jgi:hypothetical protein
VALATSETCRDGLAAHGFEVVEACGPLWNESRFGRSSEPNAPLRDLARFFEDDVGPAMLAGLEASVRRRRPDVILSNDFESTGRVIAERFEIPFVLASSGPRLPRPLRVRMGGGKTCSPFGISACKSSTLSTVLFAIRVGLWRIAE